MDVVHYLNEENILIFLLQIFILLSLAKLFGSFLYKKGYPALAGEILVGIILGPTILGRFFPSIFNFIFPRDIIQQNMLETVAWFGVLFLLLTTGFEVSINSVWKQGKTSLVIGSIGVLIPFIIGIFVFMWLPKIYWGEQSDKLIFILFLATAASISAIPEIAKILHDLDILKTDLGLTTLSAFVINDLLGWFIFILVLNLSVNTGHDIGGLIRTFLLFMIFAAVCLTFGNKIVGKIIHALKRYKLPEPATTLSFITVLAMISGAIAQWIGIHAILGIFLAGIMVGNTREISERSREIISQMVHSVFVPIFFVSIGIKIDFLANFNILLVAIFTGVAIGGKFIGAWLGCLVAKLSKGDSFSIGIAHIPGGAMQIVISILALELNLITEQVFVAIVFAGIVSSILVGPLLSKSIKMKFKIPIYNFLLKEGILAELKYSNRWKVIEELVNIITKKKKELEYEKILKLVKAREELMGTNIEDGIAIPHARVSGLKKPIISFGRSEKGVEWDSRDGKPVNFVFLILTPLEKDEYQTQIVSAIAKIMISKLNKQKLSESKSAEAIYSLLYKKLLRV